MKTLILALFATLVIGCSGGASDAVCNGDNCICTGDCAHTCQDGAPNCHVQGDSGKSVDVSCKNNVECHVECSQASSCDVDCGGSTECHVTCPDTGCQVTSCTGDCIVTCGIDGTATMSGTTATCP